MKGHLLRKKKDTKIMVFRVHNQLIKSTELYDRSPALFDSEDGSGSVHCPEFLVLQQSILRDCSHLLAPY